MQRRDFLSGIAWLTASGALRAQPAEMADLQRNLRGRLVFPGHFDYEGACKLFNPRLQAHPRAIAFCRDDADVQTAVQWAVQKGWPLSVRSGGHSYEGFCLGSGLAIDVSELRSLEWDSSPGMRVGSGWRLGKLYESLAQRKLAFPGGSCPTVGLTGFTLGGGYGLLSRSLGLGCDNLRGAQIVTADGRSLRVDAYNHPDLFWALRGAGGGNFGVVTALEYQLYKEPEVTLFRLVWPWDRAAEISERWLTWAPQADPRLSCAFSLRGGEESRVRCTGIFQGSPAELKGKLLQAPEAWSKSVPLLEALQFIGGDPRRTSPPFQVFSRFLSEPTEARQWKPLLAVLSQKGPFSAKIQIDSFGGRINQIAPGATAFCHRQMLGCLQGLVYWNRNQPVDKALRCLHEMRAACQGLVADQAYQNYVDLELQRPLQAYYGGNLERLRTVRKAYDPEQRFQFPQSL